MPLLQVTGLCTRYATDEGEFAAVDGVGLDSRGRAQRAIVGESGYGKSLTALAVDHGLGASAAGAHCRLFD